MKTMKKHGILLIFALLAALCLAFGLVGCDNGGDETVNQNGSQSGEDGNQGGGSQGDTHTHKLGDWESDAVSHWKTCTECTEESERGEHTFGPNGCTVCGREETYTEGLRFELNEETDTYTVTGLDESVTETKIIIPHYYLRKSVTSIGEGAFENCTSLKEIEIPDSVTSIGMGAFGFMGLTEIVIPNSVTSIGMYAFYRCTDLKKIVISDGVTSIEKCVFAYTGLKEIEIPDSVTSIGEEAFAYSGLTKIEIPDSVTSIGEEAFSTCESLTEIKISNSLTSIGKFAFGCTGLKEIEIPDSVTEIGKDAFFGCSELKSVIWNAENCTIIGYDVPAHGPIFNFCNNLDSVTFGEKVRSIPDYVLYESKSLTKIQISDGLLSIGMGAFYLCTGLTEIEIPKSVTSIGMGAFGYTGLTEIEIPKSVTSIGMAAFGYTALRELKVAEGNPVYHAQGNCLIETKSGTIIEGCKTSLIPKDGSVTSIGTGAFVGCTDLTEIEIPNSVTSIGDHAFFGCDALTSVTFETTDGWTADGNPVNVSDPALAAEYLKNTYSGYTWKRS